MSKYSIGVDFGKGNSFSVVYQSDSDDEWETTERIHSRWTGNGFHITLADLEKHLTLLAAQKMIKRGTVAVSSVTQYTIWKKLT